MGAPGTTPGPWMAAASPSSVVGWPVVKCGEGAGRSICSLSYLPGNEEVMAETRANGRQIAKSPEMYDCLVAARDLLGNGCGSIELKDRIEFILAEIQG